MIVTEDRIYGPNVLQLLDEMVYLDESYSGYDPYMVSIRRNDRFEQDLIKLEEFCEYAEKNGIDDAGYAIHEVCRANNVSTNNIGFFVEEASCYSDDLLCETAMQLSENGYHVCVAPVPTTSIWYQSLNEAMELDEDCSDYETSPHMLIYGMDYALAENVLEDISDKVGGAKDWAIKRGRDRINDGKAFVSDAKDSIAKKLSAAKQKVVELTNKVRTLTGDAKAMAIRNLNKAKALVASLKDKLVAAKNGAVKLPGKAADSIKSGASYLKGKAVGAGSYVKDKVSGAGSYIKGKGSAAINTVSTGFGDAKKKVFG